MLELLLIFAVIMIRPVHRQGFGQFSHGRKRQVFFITGSESHLIMINGFDSGLRGSGRLYFPATQHSIVVEVLEQNTIIARYELSLTCDKMMVPLYENQARIRAIRS